MIPRNPKLLIILDPSCGFHPLASERELNEVTVMMNKKWEVHLINSREIRYKNLSCDCRTHKVLLMRSPDFLISRLFYLLFSVYKGAQLVRKFHIDTIMAINGHIHLGLAAYLVKIMTGRKCIIRVNEDDVLALMLFLKRSHVPVLNHKISLKMIELTARKIERFVFKHVDWIVTQGPMHYEQIRRIADKVTFIPLWIDVERFRPFSLAERNLLKKELLNVGSDTKVLLFVGRIHLGKDVETLLHAFKELSMFLNNILLALIGIGPQEEECVTIAKKLHIFDTVKFLGYIPNAELPKYYNISDVYILPSLWEEWSNTIMEAMACGVPVIATNVGANPFLVKENQTGFLVPPKNPHMLADKVAYVLTHSREVEKLTLNAVEFVRKYKKEDIGELYKKKISEISRKQGLYDFTLS